MPPKLVSEMTDEELVNYLKWLRDHRLILRQEMISKILLEAQEEGLLNDTNTKETEED